MPLIKGEKLNINTAPVDSVGGAQPEPEERPVQRILLSEAAVAGTLTGHIGTLDKVTYESESTVGAAADSMRSQCQHCRHFDRETWLKRLKVLTESTDPVVQHDLNNIRGHLLETQNAELPGAKDSEDERDIEYTLKQMGLCQAFSHLLKEPCYTTPWSTCPATDGDGNVLPVQFVAKNLDHKRAGNKRRDDILNAARNKK